VSAEENSLRGADIVARSLARLGCAQVFTLSGNHIMSIFDAAIEAKLDLVHVRHEAAAVHMADAWGRLTGEVGVAMVTGGPGHANAVGALYTALGAESPMVLLSGHAATWELGRGGFQEIRQADMAAPVSKASFTAMSAATLGRDVGEAIRIATSGRPGPVHLSLPSDLLEERVESNAIVWPDARASARPALTDAVADAALAAIAAAARPIILAPPQLSNMSGRALLGRLEAATQAPAVILESPRGVADATLGAFSDLVRRADLIVLIGKALDFTTRWASGSTYDPAVRLIAIDPEAALVERAAKEMDGRLLLGCIADTRGAAETLIARAAGMKPRDGGWLKDARAALDNRPAAWASIVSQTPGRLHPAQVFRALRPYVERDPDTVLICDGGEFAQWGQSMLPVRRRMINGVAGSIGGSLSFANAARLAEPKAPVFVVLGDGTIGFHLAEFETAVRRKLPFVAVLGNDALWNAESQIQLREYGAKRMHGCDLTPARYDLAVAALGGHGEYVEKPEDLPGAIERSLASGKPACINVMTESIAAPVIGLGQGG
jgi:acetolactate synthase-1/2/3 large subunit